MSIKRVFDDNGLVDEWGGRPGGGEGCSRGEIGVAAFEGDGQRCGVGEGVELRRDDGRPDVTIRKR